MSVETLVQFGTFTRSIDFGDQRLPHKFNPRLGANHVTKPGGQCNVFFALLSLAG